MMRLKGVLILFFHIIVWLLLLCQPYMFNSLFFCSTLWKCHYNCNVSTTFLSWTCLHNFAESSTSCHPSCRGGNWNFSSAYVCVFFLERPNDMKTAVRELVRGVQLYIFIIFGSVVTSVTGDPSSVTYVIRSSTLYGEAGVHNVHRWFSSAIFGQSISMLSGLSEQL